MNNSDNNNSHYEEIEKIPLLKKENVLKFAKSLKPIDDIFFSVIIEDKDFCQELLQVILDDPNLIVEEINSQEEFTNLDGRSVRLDAYCRLGNGKYVNIEVQRADYDDHARRVRYNASLLTAKCTPKGSLFQDIPDIIMIYISAFDIFELHETYYKVKRVVECRDGSIHQSERIDNGILEIYINTEIDDHSKIARLMRLFVDNTTYNNEFPNMMRVKQQYQQIEEGVNKMYDLSSKYVKDVFNKGKEEGREEGLQKGLQKGLQEGREEGLQEGLQEKAIRIALKMLQKKQQLEFISEMTELPLEQLKQLQLQYYN